MGRKVVGLLTIFWAVATPVPTVYPIPSQYQCGLRKTSNLQRTFILLSNECILLPELKNVKWGKLVQKTEKLQRIVVMIQLTKQQFVSATGIENNRWTLIQIVQTEAQNQAPRLEGEGVEIILFTVNILIIISPPPPESSALEAPKNPKFRPFLGPNDPFRLFSLV